MKKPIFLVLLLALLVGCTAPNSFPPEDSGYPVYPPLPDQNVPPQNPPLPPSAPADDNSPFSPENPMEPPPIPDPTLPPETASPPAIGTIATQDTVLHFYRTFSTTSPGVLASEVAVSQTADVEIRGKLKELPASSYERLIGFDNGTLKYTLIESVGETDETCHSETTVNSSATVLLSDSEKIPENFEFHWSTDSQDQVEIELWGNARIPITENYVAESTSAETDCSDEYTDEWEADIEQPLVLLTTDPAQSDFSGSFRFHEAVPEPNSIEPILFPPGAQMRPADPVFATMGHFSLSNRVLEEKIGAVGIWTLEYEVHLPRAS